MIPILGNDEKQLYLVLQKLSDKCGALSYPVRLGI